MPHIALITTSYPDGNPGADAAGSFVEDFAIELSKLTAVTVLAASAADSTTTSGDLMVRRFAVPRLPLSLLRPSAPADWSAILRTLRAGRQALRRLMDEDAPDHILALWALPGGWWARSEAGPRRIPFSTWSLGSDIWSLSRIPVIRGLLAKVLAEADNRYADGLALSDDVERLCGRPCEFLPSARHLPPARQTPVAAQAPYKLAYLGRWHPNKGVDLLMDALCALEDDDWLGIEELRVFGGGPLEDHVRGAAQRLVGDDRPVSVGGYLDKLDAAALIAWADYLLLPSRIESIPVIFSDAMQLSTPVIATPVGDLPTLHDRYGWGVLAKEVSPQAMTEALRTALAMSAERFGPGIAEARRAFNPAISAARFLEKIEGTAG